MISSIITPLKDMMQVISSGLLAPAIAVLLLFVAFVVIELGSLLVELLFERRKRKINIPALLDTFQEKNPDEIMEEIEKSNLFRRQKAALKELIEHRALPAASHQALAGRLLAGEELYYVKITNRTDLIARLGPMLGLMGTLIPLGPGLASLGHGDLSGLIDSLRIAFDATVLGLATASVAFVVSRVRKRWYEDNLSSLESLLEGLLEVCARERRIEE